MSDEVDNNSNNSINEKIFLLTNIFDHLPNMTSRILPLISSSNNIRSFYSFLNYNNDSSDNYCPIKEKLELLDILSKLFQMNNNLIFLFLKKCKSNIKSFFGPLIDIYLNENTVDIKNKKIIEDLLLLIINNVSVNKNILDYIYQKLSKYFTFDAKIKLTNDTFLKYLNLLDIFYTGNLIDDKNENENANNNIEVKKEIRNFIYLNGFKNKLSLIVNKSSNNINTDFPTLENGFSFITWIKLEKSLIDSYFLIHKGDTNYIINLIDINFGGHQIKLKLVDANNILLVIDENIKSNYINISNNFKYNDWNSFAFIFYSKKTSFKLYINRHLFNFYIDLKNIANLLEKKIDGITFFENLTGKSTSILFFSFSFDEDKLISLFYSIKETGFYKIKHLYRFLSSNDKEYSKYSKNPKINDNNKININKIIDINFKEQNIKNLICFICPFAYNHKNNTIDDIFGNFIGIITPESGVNLYINNYKNIENLGGIDNLLPIAELMLLAQNKDIKNSFSDKDYINYDLIEKNIMNENTFLKYVTIIKKIILGKKLNLLNANKHKFFSSLELFFEKFPTHIYSNQILNVFLQIGKEIFGSEDYIEENFVNMILLNEKIFSKFNEEIQQNLWYGVHDFFTSDYLQMKELIPMSKICLLLRFYDSKRYDKFCCKKHGELFMNNDKEKNELNVMKPDMNTKINKLFETIQLYLEKFNNEEDNVNLFKLLCLDLSPCLQIKIIDAYKKFFKKNRKDSEFKSKVLVNLLEKNNLFDIYEYVLSISLLDVKIELVELLRLLMKEYNKEIDNYCAKKHYKISQFFRFVGYHLLPIDLKVEFNNHKIDNNKGEEDEIIHEIKEEENNPPKNIIPKDYIYNFSKNKSNNLLSNYFNNKIYEKDIESMWKVLNEWLIENNTKTDDFNSLNQMPLLKLNSYVMTLCINFVSKLNPFYIDSLLIIVYSFLKNSSIINKEDLYNNETLFPWIIETIFFFYDKKNWEYFKDMEIIQLILQHSIELFKEFILGKRTYKENETLINYIFDFAYYLKSKNNDEESLNTIGAIMRLILGQILESSEWNVNLITKFCIQFMIFFKNSEELYNNKELIKTYLSQDEQNLYEVLVGNNTKKQSNKTIKKKESQNSVNLQDYIYNEDNNKTENEKKNNEIKLNEDNLVNKCTGLIPEFIYKSLFLNKCKEKDDKRTLIQIWKDFDLFNYIINYYESNIWGTSYLCKKIKLNYKGKFLQVSKDLIKEYSSNSKYKNILLNDLYKCLNFAQEERNIRRTKERLKEKNKKVNEHMKDKDNIMKLEDDEENENFEDKKRSKTKERDKVRKKNKNKEKNRDKSCDVIKEKNTTKEKDKKDKNKENSNYSDINILKINILLLSIAIDITKNEKEKIFLINKYEQFLLFCIITSLNISHSENFHEFIQSNLFDLIGYGLVFLKEKDEKKFKEFNNTIIVPLFDDIFYEKSKILKNIFSSTKTELYEKSALYELFILGDEIKNKNPDNISDVLISRTKISRMSSVMEKNLNNLINPILNNNEEEINDKNNIVREVIYGKNNDENNKMVMFVGDKSRLKRHIINSIVIYYLEEKRKKTSNKKSKVSFKIEKNDTFDYQDMQFFYNINNKSKDKLEKKIKYEKERLSNVINNLIPFFENQIKKYSISSVLPDKKRRNIYKSNKKKLFSWRGFWSNRYIFHKNPDILKCKLKNHLTKDMTKIILIPILDLEYYMPSFSKFDSRKLFNEGDYKYKINLDVEEILRENELGEETSLSKNKGIRSKSINNDIGFNYLECIYKLSYEGIWEKYRNYNEQKFNFENNTLANITRSISLCTSYEFLQSQFPINSISDKDEEYVFNCCLVKLTRHIKGIFRLEKTKINFIFNLDENKDENEDFDDINFDKDLGTCFGSTFKNKKSDKDKISFEIDYEIIKYIFIRYYYYQETGLEIYTTNNKSYYFNFKCNMDLQRVKTELIRMINYREIKGQDFKGKKVLGYEKINTNKKKSYYAVDKMKEWIKYQISTLEYLMWMNIFGGRSLNDLTQYPVFPWLITDYTSEEINYNNNNNENIFRNLFVPMGMIETSDKSITRKDTFIDTYDLIKNDLKENFSDFNYSDYLKKGDEYYDYYQNKKLKLINIDQSEADNGDNTSMVELNQLPSYYSSHYSNPTYVTHYLTRIFPFAFVSIEIQGDKFDDPNRMFISLSRTFESASTAKDDIRELIPEFYLLPEMFQNNNNLNLSQGKTDVDNNKIIINDVELPLWCNDDPNNFIIEKRKYLEKNDIKINKWIDIIFGNYQKGEKAEEIHNIFKAQSYEKMVKIDNIRDIDMRNALMRLVEVGITPMQILDEESKPKIDKKIFLSSNSIYAKSKGKTLDESENLVFNVINSLKYENLCMKNYENKKLTCNKEYKQKIEPRITKILYINQKLLKIFINNDYCYTINTQNLETKKSIEESTIIKLENNSSKFSPNYYISENNMNSFIINKRDNFILKGGFWDNRIEYNSIPSSSKVESIFKIYYVSNTGPICIMTFSEEENIIICGTKLGEILYYKDINKNTNFEEPIYISSHSDEITSISINETLHLCATASLDGYIMIYTLPEFSLVRSIQVSKQISEADISEEEFIYADNIFLSSSPLPCFIIFISSKKMFFIYNINGKYIGEVEESEDTKKLNSPIIFKNLEFQEFLIYGTDDGYIKIRSFPNMKMINMIKPFEGQEIKTLELSLDKRYCFGWSYSNKIFIIKDSSVVGVDNKENKDKKDKKENEQNDEDIDE